MLLGLGLELRLQLGLGLHPLARVRFRPGVNLVQRRGQIRQHERVRIFRAEKIAAFLRQVGFVAFFVNGEEQLFLLGVKLRLLLVRVQLQFGLVHQPQVFRVFQQLHQAFGFRLAGFDAEQQQADLPFQCGGVLRHSSRRRDAVS